MRRLVVKCSRWQAGLTGPGPDRGMVFQGYTLFPWRTVKQNVMFGLEMQGKSSIEAESHRSGMARDGWLEPLRRCLSA